MRDEKIKKMREEIISLILMAHEAQDEYVYTLSIDKYSESVQCCNVKADSDYVVYDYFDLLKGSCCFTQSTWESKEFMTSEEVVEKFKAHINDIVSKAKMTA